MSESQRDRILARRAHFIALALAATACHNGETAEANTTVVLPPAEDASHTANVVQDAGAPITVVDAAPTPEGISPETQVRYAKVRQRVEAIRHAIEVTEGKIAAMKAFGPANASAWQTLVVEVQSLYGSVGYMNYFCPKPRPETDDFLAWATAEQSKLRTIVDSVKQGAARKLADKTITGDARFDQLLQQYNQANPMPCLSIACDNW